MKFVCPKCALPLTAFDGGAAKCPGGHSYDRSREGYYNLLLGTTGGVHGDNREMIAARRRFLNTGAYFTLANEVANTVLSYMSAGDAVLDMGEGEGYYTDIVERRIKDAFGASNVSAFDISKDAVRLAAKRNKAVSHAVASSYKIPMADASIDIIFNVFSPLAIEETARVLKKDGIFVFVIPDVKHLWELKSAVYDSPYENEPKSDVPSGFGLISEKRVFYNMKLSTPDMIRDLFAMTPYAYRTGAAEREKLDLLTYLDCRAEFIVLVYKKL